MFWLIIAPILALILIVVIANFFISRSSDKPEKKAGNIYKQTIFREDD